MFGDLPGLEFGEGAIDNLMSFVHTHQEELDVTNAADFNNVTLSDQPSGSESVMINEQSELIDYGPVDQLKEESNNPILADIRSTETIEVTENDAILQDRRAMQEPLQEDEVIDIHFTVLYAFRFWNRLRRAL